MSKTSRAAAAVQFFSFAFCLGEDTEPPTNMAVDMYVRTISGRVVFGGRGGGYGKSKASARGARWYTRITTTECLAIHQPLLGRYSCHCYY